MRVCSDGHRHLVLAGQKGWALLYIIISDSRWQACVPHLSSRTQPDAGGLGVTGGCLVLQQCP